MNALDWFLIAAVVWAAFWALYWRGKCTQLLAEHGAFLKQCEVHEAEHNARTMALVDLLNRRVAEDKAAER